MKTKKTKRANIEAKRGALLLMGMALASAAVLMSFEWSTFTLTSNNDLIGKNIMDEPFTVFTEVEIAKPMPKEEVVERRDDEVTITPEPIPVPVPEPKPEPVITPPVGPITIITPPEPTPTVTIDPVFQVVEKMPEFPGGLEAMYKFLGENIKYPEISKGNHSQGKVYVQFTVEKNGSISSVKVASGVDKFIDKEATRVVEAMPKWTPGEQRNKAVRVSFTLPLNFVLD